MVQNYLSAGNLYAAATDWPIAAASAGAILVQLAYPVGLHKTMVRTQPAQLQNGLKQRVMLKVGVRTAHRKPQTTHKNSMTYLY